MEMTAYQPDWKEGINIQSGANEEIRNVIVEIKNVNKKYDENQVVYDLHMKIYEGEFLTMLGPSGCGKTTTLRMIGGFEEPTNGEILVEGESVSKKEPFQRNVNTVFQSYALFPHMTIFDNIAYGLKMKKTPKKIIKEKVEEMLTLVQLSGFEKRYPNQLSGGQKQRVAIARALINEPRVLLLDEPLGALDLKLRKEMQLELKRLQKKLGITFIYVTHDQEEALTMSDRIAIMNKGYLDQLDTPENVYEKPATKFVADFIGESNVFEAVVHDINNDKVFLGLEIGNVLGEMKEEQFEINEMVHISIRPENTLYSLSQVDGFTLQGIVKERIYVGNLIKCNVALANGQEIKINRMNVKETPNVGDVVNIYWEASSAVLIKSREYTLHSMIENVDLGGE